MVEARKPDVEQVREAGVETQVSTNIV